MSALDQKTLVETGVSLVQKVEPYLEHGRNILRAKHTSNAVKNYQL